MRGNFNLSTGLTYEQYYAAVDGAHAAKSKMQEYVLKAILKYLKFNRKRKSFHCMRTERGHGGAGTVVFFDSYMTKDHGDYGDFLGLCIQDWFQDDETTLIFGEGHIYKGSFEKYFSSSNYVEVSINDDLLDRFIKNKMSKEDENELLLKFEELENKIQKWLIKNKLKKFLPKK